MNYVEEDFIFNELTKIHKKGENITINWHSGEFEPRMMCSKRISKSIDFWRNGLSKHLESHRIDLTKLPSLIFVWPLSSGPFMQATDDRGQTHEIKITKTR